MSFEVVSDWLLTKFCILECNKKQKQTVFWMTTKELLFYAVSWFTETTAASNFSSSTLNKALACTEAMTSGCSCFIECTADLQAFVKKSKQHHFQMPVEEKTSLESSTGFVIVWTAEIATGVASNLTYWHSHVFLWSKIERVNEFWVRQAWRWLSFLFSC